MDLKSKIREVPDFPKKGILFYDVTPLLQDKSAFEYLISTLAGRYSGNGFETVAGIESRGFILGSTLAMKLGAGFIPVRKEGKLPWKTVSSSYEKEYGKDVIEMHTDAIIEGQEVLVVDDMLATGGTAKATAKLVESLGGIPSFCFLIELTELRGIEKISNYDVFSLIKY